MEAKIIEIKNKALSELENINNLKELEEFKNTYLSRSSELTNLKKGMKDVSPEDRPKIGSLLNEVSRELENLAFEKYELFYAKELNEKLNAEIIDVTLPSTFIPRGKVHPLTQTVNEIVEIFEHLGFSITEAKNSPEVEVEKYNFDLLNFPPEHPAKDMQDTFYTEVGKNVVLRSQTSNAQVRTMEHTNPPIKVISPGRVYRSENVSARKNDLFHQIEGLYVDKGVKFSHLKGVLNEFIRLYFGASRPIRFRSSYFPFTEPSVEVDLTCSNCGGKGCSLCKGTGWIEVLGAGMVNPVVLENCGIDSKKYTGYAFGLGVERIAMIKYGIPDIRLFYECDLRFLKQFGK